MKKFIRDEIKKKTCLISLLIIKKQNEFKIMETKS
jgi:hypothetical protein